MLRFGVGFLALSACLNSIASGFELRVSPDSMSVDVALDVVRKEREKGVREKFVVSVDGLNFLDHTIVLTPADHDIDFVGEEGATFCGGIQLTGWKMNPSGWAEAPLPKDKSGQPIYFEQLWMNGRRATRSRLPNQGFVPVVKPRIESITDATGQPRYVERVCITNDIEKSLAMIPSNEYPTAQMCVIHKWSFARRILRSYDAKSGMVETWSPAGWHQWQSWNEKDTVVWFENVRSAFDAPGEWYYDQEGQKVLYRLKDDESLEALRAFVPVSGVSQLFAIRGDCSKGEYVRNVTFSNIAFSVTAPTKPHVIGMIDRPVPYDYGLGPTESWQHQAASVSDGAITLEGAHRVGFFDCVVSHTGNYAFRFNSGCVSNQVVGCRLSDLGDGGIWMGMRSVAGHATRGVSNASFSSATAHNLISNCVIRSGGRFNPEGTGIALTHCSDTKVVHNDIFDFLYTGVSVGWTWGYGGAFAQRNEIAWNHIHNLGQHIMSDMGGVYTLGTSHGTRVHHNKIHDVWSYSYGGWALYCDEGTEGIVMEDNVCWNTTDGGFHQHFGVGNIIRNNIFAFNRRVGAVRSERAVVNGIPSSFHFVNNIVYVSEGPLASEKIRNIPGVWANNLWYDLRGKSAARLGGLTWNEWQKCGKETQGVFADPQFEQPSAFDFRLKANSPAYKLGFRAIDLTGVGADQAVCK